MCERLYIRRDENMHATKLIFPIVLGSILAIDLVGGLALTRETAAAPSAPTTTIIFVDGDATGEATGLSWADAYTNLQDALMVAAVNTEIWVAEGVYYPDEGAGQINDVVSSTFVLTNGVAIYGGFGPGSGVDEFAERDWETYITVLSGDIDHETIPDRTDPHGVITRTANITGTNAYHVVFNDGVDETALIDGVSITAGQANGAGLDDRGGGMVNDNSSPTLRNVTFSGNTADSGGAMYNVSFISSSSPRLNNVIFTGNLAESYGGAMANGGVYGNSNPILNNVFFFGNSAGRGGGAISNGGFRHICDPTLTNVIFSGNSAGIYGGAIANFNGISSIGSVSPSMVNVTFSDNTADYGGALYNVGDYSEPSLGNAVLWGNTAVISGSQIYNDGYAHISINNSLIQSGLGGIEGSGIVTDGGGNLDGNPLFVRNPNLISQDYGNLHLQPGSPAIDTGTNDGCPVTDPDGNARPLNATCDMGAYEFVPPVLVTKLTSNSTPKPGEMIRFTIQVDSILTETITGGWISDTLPVGLTFLGPITLDPPEAGLVGTQPPFLATDLIISSAQAITLTFPVIISTELEIGIQVTNLAVLSSTEMTTPSMGPMLGIVTLTIAPNDFYLPVVFGDQ